MHPYTPVRQLTHMPTRIFTAYINATISSHTLVRTVVETYVRLLYIKSIEKKLLPYILKERHLRCFLTKAHKKAER